MKLNSSQILFKTKTCCLRVWFAVRTIPLRSVGLFFLLQFGVLIMAFIFFGLVPVHREVKSITKHFDGLLKSDSISPTNSNADLIQKILTSEHHEAFLKSNVLLSKTDSISLLIDLSDSLVILTFKGVSLFESKISNITFNKGLKKLPLFIRDSLYSGPFQVLEEISSIEKFPIVLKKAPKDTLEANLANAAPVLPKLSDVFYLFSFENSMAIEVIQQEKDLVGHRSSYRKYLRDKSNWLRKRNSNTLINSEERGYTYRVSIEIPREDARSIYRALPIKPFVVVRY